MKLLKDYADIVLGGTPSTSRSDFWDGEIPWVSIVDFQNDRTIYKTEKTITEAGLRESNTKLLNEGDIIISARGTVGKVAICGKKMAFNQSCYALKSKDQKKLVQNYLFYLIKEKIRYLQKMSVGGVFNTIIKSTLERIPIELPSILIQKSISEILRLYDDMIEINQRRIELLEESARLLYREWFVYFRFPGHENVKFTDGLPEGWQKIKLKDIINSIESGSRPKGGAIENGIPSIGAENVNGIGMYDYSKEKYIPEEYYQKMKKGKLKSGDVLLYKDGVNIGRTSIVGNGFPHKECSINEHVFILRTRNNIQNWLYFFLSQEFIKQGIANLNSNSAQPGISRDKLFRFNMVFPDMKIVKNFDNTIGNNVKKIFTLSIQNQKLAQARDLLLPRLMSGKIDVSKIDNKTLEEAKI